MSSKTLVLNVVVLRLPVPFISVENGSKWLFERFRFLTAGLGSRGCSGNVLWWLHRRKVYLVRAAEILPIRHKYQILSGLLCWHCVVAQDCDLECVTPGQRSTFLFLFTRPIRAASNWSDTWTRWLSGSYAGTSRKGSSGPGVPRCWSTNRTSRRCFRIREVLVHLQILTLPSFSCSAFLQKLDQSRRSALEIFAVLLLNWQDVVWDQLILVLDVKSSCRKPVARVCMLAHVWTKAPPPCSRVSITPLDLFLPSLKHFHGLSFSLVCTVTICPPWVPQM